MRYDTQNLTIIKFGRLGLASAADRAIGAIQLKQMMFSLHKVDVGPVKQKIVNVRNEFCLSLNIN